LGLWKGIALSVLLAGSAAAAGEAPQLAQNVELQSAEKLDATALNGRLRSMARKGSPISLVLELIGGTEETPRVLVDLAGDEKVDFNRVTVIVVRDGFQDDSVRGDWHEFKLSRSADGDWTVDAARRAYRCWRGTFKGYSSQICS